MDDVVTDPVSGDENAAVFGGDIPKHTGGERCLNLNQLYIMKQIKTLGDNHQLFVRDVKTGKEFLINKNDALTGGDAITTTYDPTASGLTATDVQAAIDEVVASAPTAQTTVTIDIPSSATGDIVYSDGRPNAVGGILGMGTTSIELLPAPGAGLYYDVDSIRLEYAFGTTAYTSPDFISVFDGGVANYVVLDSAWITSATNKSLIQKGQIPVTVAGEVYNQGISINTAWTIATYGTNPTLGNGTLRAIITYTVRTSGV